MVLILGLGLSLITFFHLITHAYFKAIIFIRAGGIIHAIKDYQDLRIFGGALTFLPKIFRIFLVANLSLCGIPFIAGFYSKDLILELFLISRINFSIFLLVFLATILTLLYSLQILKNIFLGTQNMEALNFSVEVDQTLSYSTIILLIPSIRGGL